MRRLLLVWGLLCVLLLSGCLPPKDEPKDPHRVQIYTTLYPLAFFAEKIGAEHVQVTNLVPTGTDAHDFEPSAKVLAELSGEADLFLYNGIGFEPWVEKINSVIDEQKTQKLDASKKIKPILADEQAVETHPESATEKDHEHGQADPHVWLDPNLAKKQALAIKESLVKQDPAHRADYEQNFQQLSAELDKLDQEFTEVVQHAKQKTFVTSHNAFSYLAKQYGLEQIAITGLSPSDEPSAKELERIIETIKKHRLRYICFEKLVNPDLAKTVQKEVGVKALVLNPLEGLTKEEVAAGEDYFSLMRMNKENLAKALERK